MKWGMLLFLLLPILGHMYVFWRIWQILPLGGWYKAALISCLLMGLISLVVIFTAGLDRWPLPLARIIYEAGTSWPFILLYLFMLFALLDLGRLTHLVKPSFLQSSAAGSLTVALLISAIFLYGNINYQHKVRRHITIDSEGKVKKPVKVVLLSDLHLGYHNTREDLQKWVRIVNNEQADAVLIAGDIIDISLRPLLEEDIAEDITIDSEGKVKKPVKVVLLSDLHLGYHNTREDLQKWVRIVNNEQADAVLIAGDIIDISLRPLLEEDMAEVFRQIKAPVYACLGNHEYYAGTAGGQDFFKEANIQLLRDSHAVWGDLCIIGRDDRTNRSRQSIRKLTKNIDPQKFSILLDHQPYHLEQAEHANVDFQFSGHTHHGQVWPISWITEAIYEKAWGKHQRGKTHYYVTSGMGIWGGKFRIGTHSEYVVATIK